MNSASLYIHVLLFYLANIHTTNKCNIISPFNDGLFSVVWDQNMTINYIEVCVSRLAESR